MTSCLVLVFAALVEFAVVNVFARKQELKKQFLFLKQVVNKYQSWVQFLNNIFQHKKHKKLPLSLWNEKLDVNIKNRETISTTESNRDYAQLVDFISGFIFPIIFIIFNIIYWMIYFNMVVIFYSKISFQL